jgi:iron complex transport system substrate-binding protein
MRRFLFLFLFISTVVSAVQTKTIIDMTGRSVEIPASVNKVVTAGGTPAVNAFLFALGCGDTIQNGMPGYMSGKNWKFQSVFAPKIATEPVVSNGGPSWDVNTETLSALTYDVVFVVNKISADNLVKKGFPVVVLYWDSPESIKNTMTLLGNIMGKEDIARDYNRYYDDTLKSVAKRVSNVKVKPKALYLNYTNLSLPMTSTATWVIENACGINVAKGQKDHAPVNIEQLLAWNPDYLFVWNKNEIDAIYKDQRFTSMNAVKNKKVFVMPMGAHVWSHYTPEQPLAVLWAAEIFFPDTFKDTSIRKVVYAFYGRFFNYKLSEDQITQILNP